MPLIRRTIELTNKKTTHARTDQEHTFYVALNKVRPGDKIVEPSTSAQLADLALRYPAEYGEAAKKAGITPGALNTGNPVVAELMTKPAKEIAKAIADLNPEKDEEVLWGIWEAETGDQGAKRATVLTALEKQGIKE